MLILFMLVTGVCCATLAGFCLWLRRQLRQQEQQQAEYSAQLEALIRRLDSRFEAQKAISLRTGEELRELRKALKALSERLVRLEQRDPGSQPFLQAARMASMGATPDELARTCGLSRSEAELMSRIQQKSRNAS